MNFTSSALRRWQARLPLICSSVIVVIFLSKLYHFESVFPNPQEMQSDLGNTPNSQSELLPDQDFVELLPPVSVSACNPSKPNVILTAIDGLKWQHQIFIFLQSLEVALGREALEAHRAKVCPPAPVEVKIIVPKDIANNIPSNFKPLLNRYPSLEFVGVLPDIADVGVVFRRFQGWSDYLENVSSKYDRVLASDLDIMFQRNPFSQPMRTGVEMLHYAEWRGLKIGQDRVHQNWFNGCLQGQGGPYVTKEQYESYKSLDIICDGSIYGTAQAMKAYMRTMASQLHDSRYLCNDQAMHIHIYYSRLIDKVLRNEGLGKVELVPNAEALFGTVGTNPVVTFNEWGEILNEMGDVQCGVHQYKTHWLLSEIVKNRYGWMTDVDSNAAPTFPKLVEDWNSTMEEVWRLQHSEEGDVESGLKTDSFKHTLGSEVRKGALVQYNLANMSADVCGHYDKLCSCKYEDCQQHYENHTPAPPG